MGVKRIVRRMGMRGDQFTPQGVSRPHTKTEWRDKRVIDEIKRNSWIRGVCECGREGAVVDLIELKICLPCFVKEVRKAIRDGYY